MVIGPGLDKLDLELPPGMPWKGVFANAWNNEGNDKLFKVTYGGMYQKAGDLRGVGLDARLSCGHRFHEKLGPKLEILGMGKKTFSDVIGIVDELLDGDACEAAMLRVDLTADTAGIPVSEFEKALYVRNKQTSQTEYGKAGGADVVERAYRRGKGQTIYFGRGAHQTRIYNKTEHRIVLLNLLNRERKQHDQPTKNFQEEYGYNPSEIRTRVELQCGNRGAEKLWGISRLGEIHRLADVSPFYNFRFAHDAKRVRELDELDVMTRGFILLLREHAINHSLAETRCFLRQLYDKPDSYRKFIRRYEALFMPQTQLTQQFLNAQYRRSIVEQLAA